MSYGQTNSGQQVNLKLKGLYTAANDFTGVPEGALDVADNIVIDHENLAEPRRGFSLVSGSLPSASDRVHNFAGFQNVRVFSYGTNKLGYDAGAGPVSYSGTYAPPDNTLAQVRFFEANKNLYISTASGVYKIDTYTNTPVPAGVPKGLDMQLALTGSSGFFGVNTAVTITGSTVSGAATLSLLSSIADITTGQYVQGTGVPVGTTVSSITPSATVLITTGTTAAGSNSITAVPSNAGLAANQLISGNGIISGTRISSISGAGPYTVTMSQSAIASGTTVPITFSSDPVITMSANATANGTGVALNFSAGSQVAYRLVWGIQDGNQNIILGAPTQFASITNTTGSTANVIATSSIPAGITTAHFYQLYRSAQTAGASITPLDDEQLVFEGNPTSTDITNEYISITDQSPDSLRGASLYTSTSQEGIGQANEPPPYCKDFCSFKDFAFYANTKSKQRLALNILSVGSPNGIQAADTLTVAGVTFTAGASENTATGTFKIFTAGTPGQNIADTANSLIKVINRYVTNTSVYAYLLSGPTDLPGQILLEEKGNGGNIFYAVASAHGTAYFPALPTSGTTVPSKQAINKNGIIISKEGEPESAPSINLVFAGSASKNILRIIPLSDYVVILKEDGIYRINGTSLANFLVSPIDLTASLIAPNTAASLSNEVYGLFDQGVCSVSVNSVNVRSRPIENVINNLISTALSTIQTVAFGVGYETDRKYILSLPATNGDTTCQQQYVFNVFTTNWTRWTRVASAGFVDPVSKKLYLGNGGANTISVENKNNSYLDYLDEPFAVTITHSDAYTVFLSSILGITIGDVLYSSSTVASVVTSVDIPTSSITVENRLTWPNGAAQVFIAIESTVQWKPFVAGNPVFVRQFSEGALLFKRARFKTATLSFYTDVQQSFEDISLTGNTGNSNFGFFPWGQSSWGGLTRAKGTRFIVPQDMQMCSQISPKLTIRSGYSNWACQGIAFSVVEADKEIAS